MQAPRMGNGADFDWNQPYRMYHGDRIPGFPQHPHRGFETLTATLEGLVDHSDSSGCAGRYGQGDLQWMTAGRGVVHGEMFPLVNKDKPNTLRLFQIWLNLPAKDKMVPPAFVMHWAEQVPKLTRDGVNLIVFAGEFEDKKGLPPPQHSWASNAANDVTVWLIELEPGSSFVIPPSKIGSEANRALYFVEGTSIDVCGKSVTAKSTIMLDASKEASLKNTANAGKAEFLLLQGRPIGEPVVQHGPFVMNTQAEIQQAFMDYRKTEFGGWPWPQVRQEEERQVGVTRAGAGRHGVPARQGWQESKVDMVADPQYREGSRSSRTRRRLLRLSARRASQTAEALTTLGLFLF